MLDIKWIRQFPHLLDQSLQKRGAAPLAQQILEMDHQYLEALQKTQELQAERNDLAKQIGVLKSQGKDAQPLIDQGSRVRSRLEAEQSAAETRQGHIRTLLDTLPNILAHDVPDGASEADNVVVATWGEKPTYTFTPQSHDLVGKPLGLDLEGGAALAGSRFVVLAGPLARLERALAAWMLDMHTQEFGYLEISPPYLVRPEAAYGVGQLPKFADDLFTTTDGRVLISTSEVPLTNLVRDRILKEAELPLRYTAFTPCFRSEAGAAGKDTQGMIRVHQFSKVEIVSITTSDQAKAEHERVRHVAEEVLRRLGLHYQTVLLCSGDTGFASEKTYDLEVWMPGQQAFREISSCSSFGNFQGRRLNARYRDSEGRIQSVHTLNGSALAVGRTLVALLETYQQADGSLAIPEVLQPYMGGMDTLMPWVTSP